MPITTLQTAYLTANGNTNGEITLASTSGFWVGAKAYLSSDVVTSQEVIISFKTTTKLGVRLTVADNLNDSIDMSEFLVSDSALITQPAGQVFPDNGALDSTIPSPGSGGTSLTLNLASWLGSTAPTVGQKTSANSIPVVIASDQSLSISNGLPPNAATESTLATLLTQSAFQARINTLGQKTSANSTPVVISSDQSTLPISGSVTATVSGTIPVSQSGAWTVTATGPLTDSQLRATPVPISASSLPLPTGASTEAKQPALGTAGTASTDVITVQGISGMTAVKVDGSAVTQPVSGTVTANQGGTWNINNISGTVSLPTGASQEHTTAASPNSTRLSDGAAFYDAAKTGQLPTALVGGRLDINLGSWLGSTAPTVGQKTMASSLPITISSDQSTILVRLTDGVNSANVKAASTAATAVDAAQVVALSPNSPLPPGTNTIGAVNQGTGGASFWAMRGGVFASTNNSTTTSLGIAGTFTGTSELITSYQEIDINIAGTPSNASGTLYFEFSPDGTNWDVSVPVTLTSLSVVPQILRVILPYFRVRYVNDGIAQTTFRLTTMLHTVGSMRLTRFLNQSIDSTENVENVRAFVSAFNPVEGVYSNITQTPSANSRICLDTVPHNPGRSGFAIARVSTSATTEVAIRNTTYTEQTSGAQRSIVSTSALDTAAGTGARTVKITYYTLSGSTVTGPHEGTVTLNGTTAVNTVETNIALIEKIEVITAGSGGVNAGAINLITGTGGVGTTFAQIAASERRTLYGHHYIPNNFSCFLTAFRVSSTASSGNTPFFGIRSQSFNNTDSAEIIIVDGYAVQGSIGFKDTLFATRREIIGPAKIIFYVTPTNIINQTQRADVAFYDVQT